MEGSLMLMEMASSFNIATVRTRDKVKEFLWPEQYVEALSDDRPSFIDSAAPERSIPESFALRRLPRAII